MRSDSIGERVGECSIGGDLEILAICFIVCVEDFCSFSMEHPEEDALVLPVLFHSAVVIEMFRRYIRDRCDARPCVAGASLDEAMAAAFQRRVGASLPHAATEEALDGERGGGCFLRRVAGDGRADAELGCREGADGDACDVQDVCNHSHRRCFAVGAGDADDDQFSGWESVCQRRNGGFSSMPEETERVAGREESSEEVHHVPCEPIMGRVSLSYAGDT